jgi:hypothetical protein
MEWRIEGELAYGAAVLLWLVGVVVIVARKMRA